MCDRKQSICVVDLRAVIKHRKPSSFYFLYSCIADSQITLDWNLCVCVSVPWGNTKEDCSNLGAK